MNDLVDRDRELPANKRDLTHAPDAREMLIHHHHIFSKTGTEKRSESQCSCIFQEPLKRGEYECTGV